MENEIGIELLTDGTWKMKIGNGVDMWASLPYQAEPDLSNYITKEYMDLEAFLVSSQLDILNITNTDFSSYFSDWYEGGPDSYPYCMDIAE